MGMTTKPQNMVIQCHLFMGKLIFSSITGKGDGCIDIISGGLWPQKVLKDI